MAKELSQPAPWQGVAEGFSCKESDSKCVQFACLHVSSATEHQTPTDGMEANGHAVFQGPAVELSGGHKALSSTSAKSLPSHQVQHRWLAKSHLATGAVLANICPRVKDIEKHFIFLKLDAFFSPKCEALKLVQITLLNVSVY